MDPVAQPLAQIVKAMSQRIFMHQMGHIPLK